MALSEIKFFNPETLTETFELLAALPNPRIIAGGTDLLVDMKEGLVEAENLISLENIQEFKNILEKKEGIQIGAMVTPQEISSNALINTHLPALAEAAGSMASAQIRTQATIGGNIASAVPSADLPPTLIASEAAISLVCNHSNRKISLSSFFKGPRETVCGTNELLASIFIPYLPPNSGISYQKFSLREANALAVASAAARLTLKNGKIQKGTIVLGAVAPIPLAAEKASAILWGQEPSEILFARAAEQAQAESSPISDVRGSVWHRKELIATLVRRALQEAAVRAEAKAGNN